jgi:aryl-alcohol dehydrogenase-like predicted oxidoreductase
MNNLEKQEQHQILILPGLSGNTKMVERATKHWEKDGIDVIVHDVKWKDESTDLETKLEEISRKVAELTKKGPVSLIGLSAGGSAAFNTFLKNSDFINKAISICGRLREGEHKYRSLEKKFAKSKSFKESVLLFEKQENNIPEELKKRMLTTSARFGDQHVPADTSYIENVQHIKVPMGEHSTTIGLTLTVFKDKLINFIKLAEENAKSTQ